MTNISERFTSLQFLFAYEICWCLINYLICEFNTVQLLQSRMLYCWVACVYIVLISFYIYYETCLLAVGSKMSLFFVTCHMKAIGDWYIWQLKLVTVLANENMMHLTTLSDHKEIKWCNKILKHVFVACNSKTCVYFMLTNHSLSSINSHRPRLRNMIQIQYVYAVGPMVKVTIPQVVGAQSYRLSAVDEQYCCPSTNSWENNSYIIHDIVLWHFVMCTSVNCHTYILGMMLNCIRTKWNCESEIESVLLLTVLRCYRVRYYALHLVGHPLPTEPVSRPRSLHKKTFLCWRGVNHQSINQSINH